MKLSSSLQTKLDIYINTVWLCSTREVLIRENECKSKSEFFNHLTKVVLTRANNPLFK